tara:strand:- start:84 stop:383 length:300 start_codon:yes stop_codon:yes gene_type:complete
MLLDHRQDVSFKDGAGVCVKDGVRNVSHGLALLGDKGTKMCRGEHGSDSAKIAQGCANRISAVCAEKGALGSAKTLRDKRGGIGGWIQVKHRCTSKYTG